MNCSACDALKAKNKTCWRHPRVEPQSMGLEKLPRIGALPSGFTSPRGPAAPQPLGGGSGAAPINHQANLDLLFPHHRGASKTPLPASGLSFLFCCSCGAELEYGLDFVTAAPKIIPVQLGPLASPGTIIQQRHHGQGLQWIVVKSFKDSLGQSWYECDLAPGFTHTYNKMAVRDIALDGRGWFVVAPPQSVPGGVPGTATPPPSPFVHPVGTMLQDTVSGQLCQITKHTHMGPGLSNTTPVYEVVDPFTNGTTWIPCCVVASGRYTVVP